MSTVPTFTLQSGYKIPRIGMGCSRNVQNLSESIYVALKTGYRLFDSARIYENEKELGTYLKEHMATLGIKREEVFITTKLPIIDADTAKNAEDHVKEALENLQLDYIDLLLIHYPKDRDTVLDENREINKKNRKILWQKLEEFHGKGLVRSIGVSNYEVYHLTELFEYSKVPVSVNQVEFHPYCTKTQLHQVCKEKSIFMQAYSSLIWGNQDIPNEDIVKELMAKYNISHQFVLYAFAVNVGVGIIPKSATPSRIDDNLNKVAQIKFTEEEMKKLMDLDKNQQFCPRCYPWRVL